MINTIRNKIVSLLQGIDYIKAVYTYPEVKPSGYPYAIVVWERNESEALTNQQDRVNIVFKIALVQEKMEELKGKRMAENIANDRAAKIEALFRGNNDLDLANVLRVLPIETKKSYDNSATRIVVETTIKVLVVQQVSL